MKLRNFDQDYWIIGFWLLLVFFTNDRENLIMLLVKNTNSGG